MLSSAAEQPSPQLLSLGQCLYEYFGKKEQLSHQEEKFPEEVQLKKVLDVIIQINPIVTQPFVQSRVMRVEYDKDFQYALWRKKIGDPRDFLVGLFELGEFDKAKYACWRLLAQGFFVFVEENFLERLFVYEGEKTARSITSELVKGMLNPKCWLKKRFYVEEIKDAILLKENVFKIIDNLQDKKLKQQAFWQALFPQTLFGNVFHIERGSSPPNIEHGYLNKIVKCLAEQLTGENSQQEIFIDCHTLFLLRENTELQSSLEDSVPELDKRIFYLLYPVVNRITDDKHSPSPELREKIVSSDHCVNIGLLSHREDKLEKAIAAYTDAIALDPQNFYSYYYRALAYGQQGGRLNEAIQDCEEAIRLMTNSEKDNRFNCYKMLSCFYYHNRQYPEARKMFDKLLSDDYAPSTGGELVYMLSILYRMAKRNQGDEKKEETRRRRVIEFIHCNGSHIIGQPGLVMVLFDMGNFRSAQYVYLQFIQRDNFYKNPLCSWPSSYLEYNFFYCFPESRAEFVETILDKKLWPSDSQRKDIEKVVKEVEKCKERALELILSLKDQELQQRAFWQALVPKTLLGSVFYVQRGILPSDIVSGHLDKIAQYLEKILMNPDAKVSIDKETLLILTEDKELQRELSEYCPNAFRGVRALFVPDVNNNYRLFSGNEKDIEIEMHAIEPTASASSSTSQSLAVVERAAASPRAGI